MQSVTFGAMPYSALKRGAVVLRDEDGARFKVEGVMLPRPVEGLAWEDGWGRAHQQATFRAKALTVPSPTALVAEEHGETMVLTGYRLEREPEGEAPALSRVKKDTVLVREEDGQRFRVEARATEGQWCGFRLSLPFSLKQCYRFDVAMTPLESPSRDITVPLYGDPSKKEPLFISSYSLENPE